MSEFGYLSVLLSIILGLAITQLLQGWRGRMIYRARVRGYWPVELWPVSFLLICTQAWWAMFELRDQRSWTSAQFAVLLAQIVFIYLACALLYPDFWASETVDLRAHYFSQRRDLFGATAAVVLLSLARNVMLSHALPRPADLAFHLVFLVTSGTAAVVALEAYHKFLAIFMAGVFLAYVGILFSHLR